MGRPQERLKQAKTGLERRIAQLERNAAGIRNQLVEQHIAAPPAWARQVLGERPADTRRAKEWDRGVRAIADYRLEHELAETTPGLGPEPEDGQGRKAWRQARTVVRQVERRLSAERGSSRGPRSLSRICRHPISPRAGAADRDEGWALPAARRSWGKDPRVTKERCPSGDSGEAAAALDARTGSQPAPQLEDEPRRVDGEVRDVQVVAPATSAVSRL
jgi:hypothetical protein